MKRVYIAQDTADAQLACDFLIERGFRAVVLGSVLGTASGDLPVTSTRPEVCVEDEHAEAARAVLEHDARELLLGSRGVSPGHCANCGYDLRGQTEPRCPEVRGPVRSGAGELGMSDLRREAWGGSSPSVLALRRGRGSGRVALGGGVARQSVHSSAPARAS